MLLHNNIYTAGVARAGKVGRWRIMIQRAKDLGMLGKIQVTPRWENDPMLGQCGHQVRYGRARIGYPPQEDIRRQAEMAERD